jgi:regulation of enolase protein 1 (concanavalin A-like superfamily)
MHEFDVSAGEWLNPPASVMHEGETLVVAAEPNSDFWRTTSYNFIHDNGHALLNDFSDGTAIEVSWILDYDQQFDQA